MLFACHNVTRGWLLLKNHYAAEASRVNQHHRAALKAAMDGCMHGYLDHSLPAAPLQQPPCAPPEPSLEQVRPPDSDGNKSCELLRFGAGRQRNGP